MLNSLIIGLITAAFAQEVSVTLEPLEDWATFAQRVFPTDVRVSAKISDPVLFEKDSQSDFIPASVTKMITTAAVLAKLGGDHRFETQMIWHQAGNEARNVVLTGNGDPTFKEKDFAEFAAHLKSQGIEIIRGPVVVQSADSRWDDEVIPPGNRDENLVWCFGAQPASFMIDQNCALAAVTAVNQGSWYEPGIADPIKVDLKTDKYNDFEITRDGDGYLIKGKVNPVYFPIYLDLRVLRPLNRARALFQNALIQAGFQFTIEEGEMRELVGKTYTHFSQPLRDLLKPMVKTSLNPPLEALQRQLGRKFGGSTGTLLEESTRVIQEFITTEFPQNGHAPTFVDGSGLSRDNFVSATWIYDFLQEMKKKDYFQDFLAALAVGGKDGTLKRRWVGTEAEGRVFAKTGTLDGHSNIAGYLTDQLTPFVLLNDYDPTKVGVSKVRKAQNEMVLRWFKTTGVATDASTAAAAKSSMPDFSEHEFLVRDIQ